ncbi:MAG: hypothetical protein PHQ09_06635 [Actinomycetota bacterium]|nr:hypothetical protein [Actinomycetota bacterium]
MSSFLSNINEMIFNMLNMPFKEKIKVLTKIFEEDNAGKEIVNHKYNQRRRKRNESAKTKCK